MIIMEMQKWLSEKDLRRDEEINREILEFINLHQARSVVMPDKILGCPHEEGVDYPEGEVCRFLKIGFGAYFAFEERAVSLLKLALSLRSGVMSFGHVGSAFWPNSNTLTILMSSVRYPSIL
jgi:hypothetical protein